MILLKRIMGLPGEKIRFENGIVIVNDSPLEEPYTKGRRLPPILRNVTLGPDEYFVIGDNRDASEYGSVSRKELLGKVLF